MISSSIDDFPFRNRNKTCCLYLEGSTVQQVMPLPASRLLTIDILDVFNATVEPV